MLESTKSAAKSAPSSGSRGEGCLGPRCPFRVHLPTPSRGRSSCRSYRTFSDLIRADETPAELDISIVPVFAMFAPMLAALVMRMFVSKEGLKGSLGPLRKWRFYGIALVLPALLVSLAIGIAVVTGWGGLHLG